jgi:hypothetical protein
VIPRSDNPAPYAFPQLRTLRSRTRFGARAFARREAPRVARSRAPSVAKPTDGKESQGPHLWRSHGWEGVSRAPSVAKPRMGRSLAGGVDEVAPRPYSKSRVPYSPPRLRHGGGPWASLRTSPRLSRRVSLRSPSPALPRRESLTSLESGDSSRRYFVRPPCELSSPWFSWRSVVNPRVDCDGVRELPATHTTS